MGNHISFGASEATGKIVFSDGSVQEFDQPVTVAELMLENPLQVVVEFHSAVKQKRPTPLPADKKLEMRKVYLMLPVKRGKPVALSGEETRRILLMVNSALRSKYLLSSSRFLPWLCHNAAAIGDQGGALQRKQENIAENKEGRSFGFDEFLPELMEAAGRPEYLSRQLSGKGWKPSLDTIKEKKNKRKLSHWLFLKSFLW